MAENVLVRPWPQEDRGLAPPPTDPTAEVVVSTADAAALSPLVPTACTADAALAPSMPIACMTMATKRATKLIEIREHSPIPIDCATMRHELLRGAIKCIGGHLGISVDFISHVKFGLRQHKTIRNSSSTSNERNQTLTCIVHRRPDSRRRFLASVLLRPQRPSQHFREKWVS